MDSFDLATVIDFFVLRQIYARQSPAFS